MIAAVISAAAVAGTFVTAELIKMVQALRRSGAAGSRQCLR